MAGRSNFNTVGEQIGEYTLNGSEGKMSINNPNLANGVYVYKLYTNSTFDKVGKIIIIK
jgi:hypothetical protein